MKYLIIISIFDIFLFIKYYINKKITYSNYLYNTFFNYLLFRKTIIVLLFEERGKKKINKILYTK